MKTKICPKCGPKPIEEFNWRNKAKGIRCNECRQCHSTYNKSHYQRTKSVYIERNTKRKNRVRTELHSRVDSYLLEHPCIDCGENDIVVLEFDHRPGTKKIGDVSRMVSQGMCWRTISKEIAKCDVRCANDHRRQTAKRGNWYARRDSNSRQLTSEVSALVR